MSKWSDDDMMPYSDPENWDLPYLMLVRYRNKDDNWRYGFVQQHGFDSFGLPVYTRSNKSGGGWQQGYDAQAVLSCSGQSVSSKARAMEQARLCIEGY